MPSWSSMPFGRYRGWPLDELPDSYLRWLLTRDLYEPLRSDVRLEYARRRAEEEATHQDYRRSQQRDRRRLTLPSLEDVETLISSGLHALARKFHPDVKGGDLARMQTINSAAEWLRARVREWL